MNWAVQQAKVAPYDHTKGTKKGEYFANKTTATDYQNQTRFQLVVRATASKSKYTLFNQDSIIHCYSFLLGHYLYLQVDPDKEPGFPLAELISPQYNAGAYDCTFSFWYYMYHDQVKDNNDAVLNVLYKRNGLFTQLIHIAESSGKTWKNAIVQLPHCPNQFNVSLSYLCRPFIESIMIHVEERVFSLTSFSALQQYFIQQKE